MTGVWAAAWLLRSVVGVLHALRTDTGAQDSSGTSYDITVQIITTSVEALSLIYLRSTVRPEVVNTEAARSYLPSRKRKYVEDTADAALACAGEPIGNASYRCAGGG